MNFKQAMGLLKKNIDIKLPEWEGFWRYCYDLDTKEETIKMHCKDGAILDIRDSKDIFFTLDNICSDRWIIASYDNTNFKKLAELNKALIKEEPEETFSFGEAIKYMKQGFSVKRKGWNGKGIFIKIQNPDQYSKMTHSYIYIDTTGLETNNPDAPKNRVPWLASQTDMLAIDWQLV